MFPSFLSSVYSLSWIGLHTHYGAICSNWGRGKVAITQRTKIAEERNKPCH